MKVFYQTNIPAPYRMDFLNELGKKCDLTVAFEGNNAKDRDAEWFTGQAEHFKCIFMKGKQVSNDQFFCPEVVRLLNQDWDKIILCGYSGPTTMLGIDYLRLRRKPFYMELDGGLIKEESRFKYLVKKHFASAAKAWFSSGEATTKWITYYGADRARCHKYPFSSLLNRDLVSALRIQAEDLPYLKGAEPGPDYESIEEIRSRWNEDDYIARRELLRTCARKRLGIEGENVIISVGRMLPGKGFDVVLNAMAQVQQPCQLYIVGGEATPELQAIIDEKGLQNIHFVPFVGKEALQIYYRAADLFVLATRSDVWGLVINEAMAQGLPVITTRNCVAGVELVEEGKNGWLIEVDDVDALSKDIDRLLADPTRCRQGAYSYRKMFGYTIEEMAARHFEILQNT